MPISLLPAPRPFARPQMPFIAAAPAPAVDPPSTRRVSAGSHLHVSYTGTSSIYTSPGYGFAEYAFQVRNEGPLDAELVRVSGVSLIVAADCPQTATEEAAAFLTPGGTTTLLELGTIRAGQAKKLTVLCGATPFNSCAGSEVRVRSGDGEEIASACSPGFV